MMPFAEVSPLLFYLTSFGCMILMTGAVGLVVYAFSLRLSRAGMVLSVLLLLASLLLLEGLDQYSRAAMGGRVFSFWGGVVKNCPAALLIGSAGCLLFGEFALRRFLKNKQNSLLSPYSIQESLDALPDGVCFSAEDGLPLLTNRKMNDLSLLLFGEILWNEKSNWNRLQKGELTGKVKLLQNSPHNLLELEDGTVWIFHRHFFGLDGETFTETVAYEITETYRLHQELEKRTDVLAGINQRLRRYSKDLERYAREKELLAAKIQVHDDVGRSLLAFRTYVNQPPEKRNREELLQLWKRNIALLKHEAEEKTETDDFTLLKKAAEAVSVRIELEGELPPGGSVRKAVMDLIHECVNNTVRHADGHILSVHCERKEKGFSLCLQNDGRQPETEVRERGGLANIRRNVEMLGGTMQITSFPRFLLEVWLPEGNPPAVS